MVILVRDRGKCNFVLGFLGGGKMRGFGKVIGKVVRGCCREVGVIVMGIEVWV